MKKKRASAFWRQKQYVIAGTLVILAAIGMTWFYTNEQAKDRQEKEQQLAQEAAEAQEEQQLAQMAENESESIERDLEEASSVILPQEATDKTEVQAEVAVEEETEVDETTTEKDGDAASQPTAKTQSTLHFSAEEGLSWPMQGDVIMGFHMDQTVYFATLDQYKYNPAILIAGAVNSKVYAAAQGKITDISQNEVTGCTVTMDLGDGYTAIYGQLKELNFEVGDLVEEGQVLGYVSEPTKYFSVEGSNLYFEIQKDGVPQDPVSLITS
ncbi:MAG: peptidoglycan DD-metalloendopeptidase family protein [Roseburia sp.]